MYKEMDGPTMLRTCGTSGHKWAEAFCEINPDGPGMDVMIGWFCNAI